MADKIRFAVSVTPVEEITDEQGNTHEVIAGEVGKSLGGSGESVDIDNFQLAGGANKQGYLNAVVNYRDAVHTSLGAELTVATIVNADFFFIKNTGHKYSSPTVLGAVTTDCVMVAIEIAAQSDASRGGWEKADGTSEIRYLEIAWLKPGQAIPLPTGALSKSITQFGANANDLIKLNTPSGADSEYCGLMVRTYQSDGTDASDGNAVEFLVVT